MLKCLMLLSVFTISGLFLFLVDSHADNIWQQTSGPKANDIKSLAIDPITPQTIYAGSYGSGVFKSVDGGVSWSAVNTGLTDTKILCLAINPSTTQTIYVGTENGGVFKSLNGGASWSAINTGLAVSTGFEF